MKPLIVLCSTFLIAALAVLLYSDNFNSVLPANIAIAVMLCFTSMGHFMFHKGMQRMLPKFVPFKSFIITFTGVIEIVFGILLLFPATRKVAALFLIVFFIVCLPANIVAALNHINIEKNDTSGPGPAYLWFRIPLQLLFIGWVYYFCLLQ